MIPGNGLGKNTSSVPIHHTDLGVKTALFAGGSGFLDRFMRFQKARPASAP